MKKNPGEGREKNLKPYTYKQRKGYARKGMPDRVPLLNEPASYLA